MATKFSNTLQMSNSTDALFQAWCSFVDQTILLGWVQTGDTGQGNPATALHPTLTNSKVFYRVYRMNDALQGGSPIFMRVDYGSGNANNLNPALWITIGTGSDGAGNITGVVFNGIGAAQANVQPGNNVAAVTDSYGSADTNRLQLMMFLAAGSNQMMILSIERSKDANGNDTGTGILVSWSEGASTNYALDRTQYLTRAGGAQPAIEVGVGFCLSNQATSAFSANVGIGLPIHFAGVAQQPGKGLVIVDSGDFAAEAQFVMSLYGANHTYQLSNSATQQVYAPTGNAGGASRLNTRVGIQYE